MVRHFYRMLCHCWCLRLVQVDMSRVLWVWPWWYVQSAQHRPFHIHRECSTYLQPLKRWFNTVTWHSW
jgi:hypothetical protein